MEKNAQIEHSRYLLNRFDHYIEGANSKGNFLLAFGAVLCGFIITNYDNIIAFRQCKAEYWVSAFLIAILISGLLSITFTIAAVFPFLKTSNSSSKKYHSLVFFQSIAEMNEQQFLKDFKKQEDKKVSKDLAKQIFAISKGLKKKYHRISWAIRFVFLQLILLLIIILIKVI
ncbi:Pycsar system effector family protein [Salegentibacter agarivorans]